VRGKIERPSVFGRKGSRKLNAENLRRIFEREVGKQQLLIRKADFTQKRLLFVIQALQTLLKSADFVALLHKEGMETIPGPLEQRMTRGAVQ
jgi:ParB family transcriptional regulator, chromosome partitioning protein